jgi:hypothetical protein
MREIVCTQVASKRIHGLASLTRWVLVKDCRRMSGTSDAFRPLLEPEDKDRGPCMFTCTSQTCGLVRDRACSRRRHGTLHAKMEIKASTGMAYILEHIKTLPEVTQDQNFGLLLSGIGGGSPELPPSSFFFGGGGGGAAFFPIAPCPLSVGDCVGGVVLDDDAKLLTLPASPYFWFSPLAVLNPDATWAPCRCWKLFAVDAAFLMSAPDTFEGSSRSPLAVRSAACLSAHDVPLAGASVLLKVPVDVFPNLLCNSLSCDPCPVAAGSAAGPLAEV